MEPTTPHILCLVRHDEPHWKQDITKITLTGLWICGGAEHHQEEFSIEYYATSETVMQCMAGLLTEGSAIQALVNWTEASVGLGKPVLLAGINTAFTVRWLRAALTRAGYRTCPFMSQGIDLHSLAVCYALHNGKPVPEVGFMPTQVYDLLSLPPLPCQVTPIHEARRESAALRFLLGLDTPFPPPELKFIRDLPSSDFTPFVESLVKDLARGIGIPRDLPPEILGSPASPPLPSDNLPV